ncbi:MAG: exodeoxyribonuclease VII large subunit [Clostridia bacterium]|nr:exodeoxyribonuclease VII large subunit [Clostridia bacterium]
MKEEKLLSEAADRVWSVSEVNGLIKDFLDANPLLQNIWVQGEISNFTNHRTGHYYLTLKDDGGCISCVMFGFNARRLAFKPENGLKVLARGRISLFPKSGQYQLYIEQMQPAGLGDLSLAYEQLKAKLSAEGLFDAARKRPLPPMPKAIGVVTSPTGAAIRDMINILSRRFPLCKIVLFPALVQGNGAAVQIAQGVRYFNRTGNVDVIIVGRGGGSIEDLWAFNDETLARTIAASQLPVISAVGHETDFTIADFVADCRAPTPSAAAELAVPDMTELKHRIFRLKENCEYSLQNRLQAQRKALESLKNKRVLQAPENYVAERRLALDYVSQKMLQFFSLSIEQRKRILGENTAKLQAMNPLSVLSRGYAAVRMEDGRVISSIRDLKTGDRLEVQLEDGKARCQVTDTIQNLK